MGVHRCLLTTPRVTSSGSALGHHFPQLTASLRTHSVRFKHSWTPGLWFLASDLALRQSRKAAASTRGSDRDGGSEHLQAAGSGPKSLNLHCLQPTRGGLSPTLRGTASACHRNTQRASRSETTVVRRVEVTLWLQENSRSTHSGLQCLSLVLNLRNDVVWSLIGAKNLMFGTSILNPTLLGDPQQPPPSSGLLLHLLKGRWD